LILRHCRRLLRHAARCHTYAAAFFHFAVLSSSFHFAIDYFYATLIRLYFSFHATEVRCRFSLLDTLRLSPLLRRHFLIAAAAIITIREGSALPLVA